MKVSVIIPTYNRAKLLTRALASVREQTLKPHEVIVVDDGSQDDTSEVIDALAIDWPELKYVRQKNAGPGAARNNGIDIANSEYIAFLDSDDQWYPNNLEMQVGYLEKNISAAFCFSDARLIASDGHRVWESKNWDRCGSWFGFALNINREWSGLIRGRDFRRAQYQHGIVGSCTQVVARKTSFNKCGSFREDFFMAEDYELWLRLASCGDVVYVDKVLSIINGSDDGLTSRDGSSEEAFANRLNIFNDRLRVENDQDILCVIKEAKRRLLSDRIYRACIGGCYEEVSKVVGFAISEGWKPGRNDRKSVFLSGLGMTKIGVFLARHRDFLIRKVNFIC